MPLAPQIKAQSGKEAKPKEDKIFRPCVHSKSPKTKPFDAFALPKSSERGYIIGLSKLSENKRFENM